MSTERHIFRKGSTTYYWSSVFFPRAVRADVFKLYSFVRVTDDFVDQVPQDIKSLEYIERGWRTKRPRAVNSVKDRVLRNIIEVHRKYKFSAAWVDAFLRSMRADAEGHSYKTLNESLGYVYGSAEVIGLMMSRVLGLPEAAQKGARLQGRAMQWINFCRDIAEDLELGRCYFPASDLRKFGLPNLSEEVARRHHDGFVSFMNYQLDRYEAWQQEADESLSYIPWRLRVPIYTARTMYLWTASQIRRDPFVVYAHKVKPSKWRVMGEMVRSSFRA